MSTRSSESIVAELVKRHARVTAPRREIIDCIARADLDVFTAEDVCAALPHLGRATVYRTLKMLQKQEIICKVVLFGDEMAYTVAVTPPDTPGGGTHHPHHDHVVCKNCSNVRPINAAAIEEAIDKLSESVWGMLGTVVGHRVEVYDICPRCEVGRA